MSTTTELPAIPHCTRLLTARIMRAYGLSPVEARRWFRRPCADLDGQTPAHLAVTIEGTRALVEFLDGRTEEQSGL